MAKKIAIPLPLADIPTDFKCPQPECHDQPLWQDEAAYRGHMAGKHRIRYKSRAVVNPGDRGRTPYTEMTELRTSYKLAVVEHELFGTSWEDLGKKYNKSGGTLSAVGRSPGGTKLRAEVADMAGDTMQLVKMLQQGATAELYSQWHIMAQTAFHNGDAKLFHTMMKDIGLKPLIEDKNAGPQTLVISGVSDDLAEKIVDTTFTLREPEIDEADYEVEE